MFVQGIGGLRERIPIPDAYVFKQHQSLSLVVMPR